MKGEEKKVLTAEEVIRRAGLEDDRVYVHIATGSTATGKEWKETIRQIELEGGAEFDDAFDPEGEVSVQVYFSACEVEE